MPQSKAKQAEVVKISEFKYDGTVRDCMVWPDPSATKRKGRKAAAPPPKPLHVLPTKGALGKPTTRGYELPQDIAFYGAPAVDDGCHVSDALRGWPNSHVVKEENDIDIFAATPIEVEAKKRKKKNKPSRFRT